MQASSLAYEKIFDARKLSTGVRWELARLVSCNKKTQNDFSKIRIDKLDLLKGNSAMAAPKVTWSMLGKDIPCVEQADFFARERSVKVRLHATQHPSTLPLTLRTYSESMG